MLVALHAAIKLARRYSTFSKLHSTLLHPFTATMKMPFFLLFAFFLYHLSTAQNKSPQIKILQQGTKTSLRGLSVVTDRVVWVSGSNGTVGKSTDGGDHWKWL